MAEEKFGTAINCMDGRVQLPVINFLKSNYALDYIDVITEAGPNGLLARGDDSNKITAIRERIDISLHAHGSNLLAVVGHYDCAGNPGSKEKQIEDIITALKKLMEWYPERNIIGLWVDENWQVSKISVDS